MSSFKRGVLESAPIMVAFSVIGVGYGVLAVEAGMAPWVTALSSVVVVSGAAQFALVGLLAAGPGPALVAVAGLGLRHVPMSASLSQLVTDQPLRTRLRLAWVLLDESFGLTLRASARGEPDLVAYKSGADLVLYSGWVGGTAIGAVVGATVPSGEWGIDVVFALLFLGLAAPMVTDWRRVLVAIAAVGTTLAAVTWVHDAWQVIVAASAAALIGVLVTKDGGDDAGGAGTDRGAADAGTADVRDADVRDAQVRDAR